MFITIGSFLIMYCEVFWLLLHTCKLIARLRLNRLARMVSTEVDEMNSWAEEKEVGDQREMISRSLRFLPIIWERNA